MRRSTLLLASATAALAVLGSGCGLLEGDGNVFELAVGDCFDRSTETGEISDVPVVDCDEPHDSEVFHTFEVEGDDEYPGGEALVAQAEEQCLPAFADYVGLDYADSTLDVFPITPTDGSWAEGDREVVCALYDLEQDELEGSMRGSQR